MTVAKNKVLVYGGLGLPTNEYNFPWVCLQALQPIKTSRARDTQSPYYETLCFSFTNKKTIELRGQT